MTHLRRYRKHDLARLYQLDQICFAADIAYSLDDLKYFLTNPRCLSLVAEDAERLLAGFIIVERAHRYGGMIGHVVTVDVEPKVRRLGVGRKLLETAEAQLKKEGAIRLTLEVAEDNIPAQTFYHRQGFVETGRIAKYYSRRLDAQVMEKVL